MSDGLKVTAITHRGTIVPAGLTLDASYSGEDADLDAAPLESGGLAWKAPVRGATTASITIATALNPGDTLDGITLAAGDRWLVKDQASPEDNGIWVVDASPYRADDMDEEDEVLGAVVYVIDGTAAGQIWAVTNVTEPTIDTDAIDWAQAGGGTLALDDLTDVIAPAPADGDVLTWDDYESAWVPLPGGAGGGDTSGIIGAGWDGGLSILVAPHTQDVPVPFSGTLTGWKVYSPQTGSASIAIGKSDYASFPTFTDIIGGGTAPGLSSADHNQSSSMASWTTAVTAGDILRFTLSSVSALYQVVVVLTYSRP